MVNALSTWLEVEICDGQHRYKQRFERGKAVDDLHIIEETDATGTQVTFSADPEIFETVEYDYDTLMTRLREQAFLNAGVHIVVEDKRPGKEQSEHLHYEGGIRSFVEYIHKKRGLDVLHDDVIYLSAVDGDTTAEVALQYNDSYNGRQLCNRECSGV